MGEVKGNYLSDRVRDNIEAAPWVRQEIIAIEASLDGALAERDALRAEVASLRALVGTVRDTLGLRAINVADIDCEAHSREIGAEVARLTAARAAKDAALRAAVTLIRDRVPSGPDLHNACAALEAALSTDAGKGWIDASGAIETWASATASIGGGSIVSTICHDDWAGSRVLIVRVAK